jgi:REP element-mobilizing transposase RayT
MKEKACSYRYLCRNSGLPDGGRSVIKGKSAIRIHRDLLKTKKMTGLSFWARGYCVSTVGLDEEKIRKYVHNLIELLFL